MPRIATGIIFPSHGRRFVRLTLGPKLRPAFPLAAGLTEDEEKARQRTLLVLAARFRKAGLVDKAPPFLKKIAAAVDAADLRALEKLAASYVDRTWTAGRPKGDTAIVTFRALGERWTSGELAKEHRDAVRTKKTAADDKGRLEAHVYPVVEHVPIVEFTEEHADDVLRRLPDDLAPASRRHVGQLISRILSLAAHPLKLIRTSPLPRGWLPRLPSRGERRAKSWLYPDEEAQLLACVAVPLAFRVFYGFLSREGMRVSEAAHLTLPDVDLDRGAVELSENKTDDPRSWSLSPGVAPALRAWLALREKTTGKKLDEDAPVFVDDHGEPFHKPRAERFRQHLLVAGVTRAALHERSPTRQRIRIHDCRAGMVTTNLATGRTETWVQDRTGHRSSDQIANYRRAARKAAELGLGAYRPLDAAIPELAPPRNDSGTGSKPTPPKGAARKKRGKSSLVHERGVEPLSLAAPEPKDEPPVEGCGDSQNHREILDVEDDEPRPTAPPADGSRALADGSRSATADRDPKPANPRAGLLEALLAGAAAAAAAGDLVAARIAHEAAGRLLSAAGQGGDVVDLEQERARRAR